MRFQVELFDAEAVPLLNRLVAITGFEAWSKKFATLQQQLAENNFLRDWQIEHNGIELRFRELLVEQERTGQFPIRIRDPLHYSLCAFAAGVVRIYDQLSQVGQNRLRGMLLDGLKPDNNLLALQHEITTAVQLVSIGFDISPNDIETGSGVDFLAKRDGAELEVECKMFTGDIGRKIHKRKVLVLHKLVAEILTPLFHSAQTGIIIRITIPDRLTCTPQQLAGIASAVSRGVVSGTTITRTPDCEVETLDFPIESSVFDVEGPDDVSLNGLRGLISAKLGRENPNLMVVFFPRKRAVVALVESAKKDAVLKGVYRQLREAAKGQFSKSRPGHLAVQFHDLDAEQMEGLARDLAPGGKLTGLQLMTTEFLQSSNRVHIHSVAYRSHGVVSSAKGQPNAMMESGVGTFVRNPSNPHYNDPRLRPLR